MGSTPHVPKRFLPPDPRVEEPYRLTPQLALRVAILGFLVLAVFGVLFLRLWALQILSGDKYLTAALDNRVRTLSIQAPRGPIVDMNGRTLVTNIPGFRLELWTDDMPKTWPALRAELRRIGVLTGIPSKKILALIKQHGNDPLTPVIVQTGLHRDQVYYLDEHAAEFPGVHLSGNYIRKYPYQSLLAQVLGYVGPIDAQQYQKLKGQGYQPDSTIGQAGVEQTYDTYLRGRDGTAQLTVDSLGRPTSQLQPVVSPRSGEELRLTIDIGLQRAAEKALRYGIQLARSSGQQFADGGAIVAMDPRDGSIRAMASYPTYEPSVWSSGRTDPQKLAPFLDQAVAAKDNYPGLNRAMQVGYPPGSTWKPVTALAALESGLLDPNALLPCTPSYTAYGHTFNNWTPLIDTGMNLATAIEQSCDTYFYRLGRAFYELPPSRGHPLQAWASRFGFGKATGIDLPGEYDGLVPTPEWLRQAHPASQGYTELDRTWLPGYSIILTIGQGQLLVTPLQMARLYSMLANGGKLVTPHIAEDVEIPGAAGQAQRVLRRFGGQPPTPVDVNPAYLNDVQQGLYDGVHNPNGTSYGVFGSFPVPIAGKTGSAEKLVSIPGYPHPLNLTQSWWCGYGPYGNPNLVVCATIENGGEGGAAAAPTALKVFEHWFGKTGTVTAHASD